MQIARQRRTDQHVQRCVKCARLADDHLALPGRTRELIETFAPLAEVAIFGTSQSFACTCDVVPSRIRAYGVPCCSICKDQTSLARQRSYRVNLRHDIKDRRIAGALLTPPRGTDSLSIRCLDTCCFFARQLHNARRPRIIVSSKSSHLRSCPSVLQLVTPPNTWAMTSDLCGHGDKW